MTAENKNQYPLLAAQLQGLWGTEQAIVKALPGLIDQATDIGLRNILSYHYAETLNQTSALRGIFKQLELSPQGVASREFEQMLNDGASSVSSEYSGYPMDLEIISTARQVEEYEITQYTIAAAEAQMQGLEGIRKTLLVTLNEEKLALVKLDFLERNISEPASQAHEEVV
jgi:ferritin-like metal-binding protein YciE